MKRSGMGRRSQVCLGLLVLLITPVTGFSQGGDYSQSSQNMQAIFPTTFFMIGAQFPDPDPSVSDTMFLQAPFTSGVEGQEDGITPTVSNVTRRNPATNGLSTNLLAIINLPSGSTDISSSFAIPLWGNGEFVGLYSQSRPNPNPDNKTNHIFATQPFGSIFSNSPGVGTTFNSVTLDMLAIPNMIFTSCDAPGSCDFGDYSPGIIPYISGNFYGSGPFPTTSDDPAIIASGVFENPTTGESEIGFFGVSSTGGGTTLGKINPTMVMNLGINPDPNRQIATSRVLVGDFDGDTCTDLAVLAGPLVTASPVNDFLYTFRGDCGGGLSLVNSIDLGSSVLASDLAYGDVDGDGSIEILVTISAGSGDFDVFSTWVPGSIQVVSGPLGSASVTPGPTLPSGMFPQFIHVTNCDGGSTDNDVLVTGFQLFPDPTNSVIPMISSDVLCFLDGGNSSMTVYPASKLNTALNVGDIPYWSNVISLSQVGTLGPNAAGWSGGQLLLIPDSNQGGNNNSPIKFQSNNQGQDSVAAIGYLLFSEVPSPVNPGGLCLQGGWSCALLRATSGSELSPISTALFAITLVFGLPLYLRRRRAGMRN